MNEPRHIAVIDIGKTNAKLALVDLVTLSEIAVVTRPNTVLSGPPWPHFDTEGHWVFLLEALSQFHAQHDVDAISVTTHGASVVLLDKNGDLAAPILDYEHEGVKETAEEYDRIRPSFSHTCSPRLANGLNVGAQLHWQFHTDPNLRERTAHILTYPQYWTHRLTGVIASDVTSIGCHTDLWEPITGKFSNLIETLDIVDKMVPVRKSTDILGPILTHIADATDLSPDTLVTCGIHDSNASLYLYILSQQAPFAVISTGTWVITMAIGGDPTQLDPTRDTLMNVNALGDAVPSARFMGGREFELIQNGHPVHYTPEDINKVLRDNIMLLPAVDPSSGPYQGFESRWLGAEPEEGSGERAVALSFYLALMTQSCLELTRAKGPTIVEGPFVKNSIYLSMLNAVTDRPVLRSNSATGTSIGAALLFNQNGHLAKFVETVVPNDLNSLKTYASRWRSAVDTAPKNC